MMQNVPYWVFNLLAHKAKNPLLLESRKVEGMVEHKHIWLFGQSSCFTFRRFQTFQPWAACAFTVEHTHTSLGASLLHGPTIYGRSCFPQHAAKWVAVKDRGHNKPDLLAEAGFGTLPF